MLAKKESANQSPALERRIDVVGFTEDQRNTDLKTHLLRWKKYGWSLLRYEDRGVFGSHLVIYKDSPPGALDELQWKIYKNSLIFKSWLFLGVLSFVFLFLLPPIGWLLSIAFIASPIVLALKVWNTGGILVKFAIAASLCLASYGVFNFINNANKEAAIRKTQRDESYKQEQQAQVNRAIKAARSLKKMLREKGVDESMVIDVKADEYGTVVLIVANHWLSRPAYEQKQMRQIIAAILQKIVPPNGLDFYLLDYLGNRV